MARVLISVAKSSVSFFILDMLKPSVKGLLWGEGLGLSTRWHKGECPQLGALIVHLCSGLKGVWYTVELCSKLVVSLEDHVVTGAGGTRTEFPRWLSKREPPEHLGHSIWVHSIWARAGSQRCFLFRHLKFVFFGSAGSLLLFGLFSSCRQWRLLSSCGAWASPIVEYGL